MYFEVINMESINIFSSCSFSYSYQNPVFRLRKSPIILFLWTYLLYISSNKNSYTHEAGIYFAYAGETSASSVAAPAEGGISYSLLQTEQKTNVRTLKSCNENNNDSFGVCLHNEEQAAATIPLTTNFGVSTHPELTLGLLEENHRAVLMGKTFVAFRNGGPFNSIGYGYNANDDVNQKHTNILKGMNNSKKYINNNDITKNKKFSFSENNSSKDKDKNVNNNESMKRNWKNKSRKNYKMNTFLNKNYYKDGYFSFISRKKEENNNIKHEISLVEKNEEVNSSVDLAFAETSIPISQMKDSQYVGVLGVGTPPQFIKPIFDTGSTNLWVVSSRCKEETCTKVTQFFPEKSSSFIAIQPSLRLNITFGTGQLSGETAADNFKVGEFNIKNQTFGLVESELGYDSKKENIFNQINFEGIIGLAFPDLSSMKGVPFYDNLMLNGAFKHNEFSFYVAKGSLLSAIFFGGVDNRFYEPPIHMFPVAREHYWETKLDALYVGNKKFCCDENLSYVIFDSGTSFNTIPSTKMKDFLTEVPNKNCIKNDAETLATYPTITYVIHGVKIKLEPEEYIVKSVDGLCKPAYMQLDVPSSYGPAYILGSTAFMRHYFTVFRRKNQNSPSMVGVAKAKHVSKNADYLMNLLDTYPGGNLHKDNLQDVERRTTILSNMKKHLNENIADIH